MKRPRVSRRTRTRPTRDPEEAALVQHRARCHVCRHAQREEIERQFLEWENPREIAAQYKFPSYRSIYRHARAFNLFRRRMGHLELALDRIIERVGEVKITAAAVIAAVRLRLEIDVTHQDIHLQALRGELPAKYYALAEAARAANAAEERDEARGEVNHARERRRPDRSPAVHSERQPKSATAQTQAAPEMPREPEPKVESAAKPPEQQEIPEVAVRKEPVSEVGMRKEPDGPPMLAGKTLPWPPGKIQFALRPRWRPIGQG